MSDGKNLALGQKEQTNEAGKICHQPEKCIYGKDMKLQPSSFSRCKKCLRIKSDLIALKPLIGDLDTCLKAGQSVLEKLGLPGIEMQWALEDLTKRMNEAIKSIYAILAKADLGSIGIPLQQVLQPALLMEPQIRPRIEGDVKKYSPHSCVLAIASIRVELSLCERRLLQRLESGPNIDSQLADLRRVLESMQRVIGEYHIGVISILNDLSSCIIC